MFTSKGLFSGIVCPYQEKCLLPGCVFFHPKPEQFAPAAAPTAITINEPPQKPPVSEDQSQDAKPVERKLQPDMIMPSVEDNDLLKTPLAPKERVFVSKPVSPPPLRRKAQNGKAVVVVKQPTKDEPSTHIPKAIQLPKKEALNPRALKTKAPATHDIRFRLLTLLHNEFVRLNTELAKDANDKEEKLVLSDQELITRALDIEENATSTPSIYGNVVKNKLQLYKKMAVPEWKHKRSTEIAESEAKATAMLEQESRSKGIPIKIETGLTPDEELSLLHKLQTPTESLSAHGYVNTIPSAEDIATAKQGIEAAQGWENCDRCKTRFQVFPGRREEDGALTSGGRCTYHFGKPYWVRSSTDPKAKGERRFRCCGESISDTSGCTTSDNHVFKVSAVKRMAALLNFEKTPINREKFSDRPICIDGEMGYTVYGLELIRLTATSWPTGKSLFDVLVRPYGEILDLNSRYSGVWPEHIADALPWSSSVDVEIPKSATDLNSPLRIVESPAAARSLLFSHLTPQTPLVGHGLENDLNAIRIIHPIIIDTALLYPHKLGLPYRNGLKALMQTHLNRQIQVVVDGKMEGHDSKEDANAAGELVRLALAKEWEKMKREGWTVQFGIFNAPPGGIPLDASKGPVGGLKRSRNVMDREDGEIELNYG